jgi:nicotinate-nucleotide adenylyltransferase
VKLGILGGSFNPVHLGHLFLADTVFSKLKLDRIVFIPAYCSPFKLTENIKNSTNDRLDMLAAALTGDSRFAIDDCEIRREGVSYTVDTLEDIITRFLPEEKPVLIIGDDLAADFPNWHESDKILQLADIAIARRNNSIEINCAYPHTLFDNEVMAISSQIVRRRIGEENLGANAAGWRSLVPAGVRAIIEDRRLYGFQPDKYSTLAVQDSSTYDCTQTVIQRVEAAAREILSTERFLHSRNTALMADNMCRRFGLDPAAGYLAGIAHDLAKQLDNKQMIKIVKNAGLEISPLEKDRPNLLHGKAAAVLLRERFCINNKDVLEAVAYHTSGCENMGVLAKIIYIADKTETSRNIDPALRKMCSTWQKEVDLDTILLAVLEKTILKLRAKKLDLSEDALMLFNNLKEKKI